MNTITLDDLKGLLKSSPVNEKDKLYTKYILVASRNTFEEQLLYIQERERYKAVSRILSYVDKNYKDETYEKKIDTIFELMQLFTYLK